MANRRMFARSIICSGRFMRLSLEAQNLYYGLGMDADDDGFAEAYPRLQFGRITEEHLSELASKGFLTILDAEDLVVHIDGWCENNLIRRDRYTPSRYLEKYPQYKQEPAPEQAAQEPVQEESAPEKEASSLVNQGLTQVRLGKDRLSQVSLEEVKKEKENLIQDNLTQEREERAGGCETEAAPTEAGQALKNEETRILSQKKPAYQQYSSDISKNFASFDSDSGKPKDSDTEFLKKKQKSIDLLLNSNYFSKERAAPGKLLPVDKSVDFLCRSCG